MPQKNQLVTDGKPAHDAARVSSDYTGKLSILFVTYNQEKYVEEALRSITDQIIDTPIEIVVADDASTDDTVLVIKEYLKNFPHISTRYLENGKNLGITKNYQRCFYSVTTEYVAIMEGDDYWTDPKKLQKQLNALEENMFLSGCSVNYMVCPEGRSAYARIEPEAGGYIILDGPSLIHDNLIGNFSTCMYRSKSLRTLPSDLFNHKSYDWIVNISLCRFGPMLFLKDVMSSYRVHTSGTWSQMHVNEQMRSQLAQIEIYNRLTGKVFQKHWDALSERLSIHLNSGDPLSISEAKSHASGNNTSQLKSLIRASIKTIINATYRLTPSIITYGAKRLLPRAFRAHVRRLATT
ncbi:glycosyltransferase [Asticcacaulis sp. DXS10W]|uniref:Glycosyltransferase n=1 Tax=Asticcacaulis currens TaxID=2984210 RepID=A0ABT5I9G4_9CAUL|nr:glycosyltransferase [Asticcacaulis currens]MDC7692827.1 glycosyltransferase [Asticcacaulis currens]